MKKYIRLVGLRVENATENSATITNIHGNRRTVQLKNPVYTEDGYLVCKVESVDENRNMLYLNYGNIAQTDWFYKYRTVELDSSWEKKFDDASDMMLSTLRLHMASLPKLYSIRLFKDGSGSILDPMDKAVAYFSGVAGIYDATRRVYDSVQKSEKEKQDEERLLTIMKYAQIDRSTLERVLKRI